MVFFKGKKIANNTNLYNKYHNSFGNPNKIIKANWGGSVIQEVKVENIHKNKKIVFMYLNTPLKKKGQSGPILH